MGRKAGLSPRCDRRPKFLPIQCGAATGAPRDVDAQQDTHPFGSRVGLVIRRWRSCAEQLAAPRQMLPLQAIGQQAVMPDAQEAVGKHVLQEAVDEFLRREDIRLQAVAIAAIPIPVADLSAFAGQDVETVGLPGTEDSVLGTDPLPLRQRIDLVAFAEIPNGWALDHPHSTRWHYTGPGPTGQDRMTLPPWNPRKSRQPCRTSTTQVRLAVCPSPAPNRRLGGNHGVSPNSSPRCQSL